MTISNLIGLAFMLGIYHFSFRTIPKSFSQKLLIVIAIILVYVLTVSSYNQTLSMFRGITDEVQKTNQSLRPVSGALSITDYYDMILMFAFTINFGIAYRRDIIRLVFIVTSIVVILASIMVFLSYLTQDPTQVYQYNYSISKPIIIFILFSSLIVFYNNQSIKELFIFKENSDSEN